MRLLVYTQKVDLNDGVLGFFHRWIEELAKRFEQVSVICLEKGQHDLPENVKVSSLGKEHDKNLKGLKRQLARIKYLTRFYQCLWQKRSDYEEVFVHMVQEPVLLAGWFWKLFGKRIYLWRNHYAGSIFTNIAGLFCRKVFYTSKASYTASFGNALKMPVGIDDNFYHPDQEIKRVSNSILFLSRLDPSKRAEILIKALALVDKKGLDFSAFIVGEPSKLNSQYPRELADLARKLGISNKISFAGQVPNKETFKYYRSHDIFVNSSRSGMFDKAIIEACLCGCLTLASSEDFKDLAGSRFTFPDSNSEYLSQKIIEFLSLSSDQKNGLRKKLQDLAKKHELSVLASRLAKVMSS